MGDSIRYRYFLQNGKMPARQVSQEEFVKVQAELGIGPSPTNWVWMKGQEKVWGWSEIIHELPDEYLLAK